MKQKVFSAIAIVYMSCAAAQAQDVLTGDKRLACEAVLCLASGQRPNECNPSMQRYFSIKFRKPSDTIKERANFLKLCPGANQSQEMMALVSAMSSGAGFCDAPSLNLALQNYQNWGDSPSKIFISNELPQVCRAYTSNAYVDQSSLGVRYVGTPERDGYWIESVRWQQAQAEWLQRTASEDAALRDRQGLGLGLQPNFSNQGGY